MIRPPLAGTALETASQGGASPATAFLSIPAITLRWVLRLRWGALAGQAATIAATRALFGLALPLGSLGAVLAFTALSNLGLHEWMRRGRPVSAGLVASVLATDTLSLGALLYFTGGPSNPFSVLFLVQITIAAVVLGPWYSAAIAGLSTATYALLFFANVPLAGMEHMHHAGSTAFGLHLQGMFVAFALAAALITYFVTRVSGALRSRDAELAELQRSAAINERLASLSTLAAGAAHELGTPLATIAVAAKELDLAAQAAGAEAFLDDARLIRKEVDRCRDIVQEMSGRASGPMGEVAESVHVEAIVLELRSKFEPARVSRLEVHVSTVSNLTVPVRGLAQALASLVKNGFDASEDTSRPVRLSVETADGTARFSVTDQGKGIDHAHLVHVGEPFFTTKPPGAGMGLGVFLARTFAERLGGVLHLSSTPGEGTCATLEFPLDRVTS
jgi:two-component system sensor histidine kinase RegB